MHNTFYVCKGAVFTSYMTISKDVFTLDRIHLEQLRFTDKPCAYMGPADSLQTRLNGSLTTIQFGTAPNGTELHGTYVNTA